MTTTDLIPIRTYRARTIRNEIKRLHAPKGERGRPSSWVFVGLTEDQLNNILAGKVEAATFESGRVELVSLRTQAD